jgi:hypothetical protein
MRFSLRNLGLFVTWVAFVVALICQVRFEAISRRWAWGVTPDIVWLTNLFFALVVVLLAIATRSHRRMFWIGCAVVAVSLIVVQATDLKPNSLSRSVSEWLLTATTPAGALGSGVQKESHIMQLASVLVYSLTPVLAFFGGVFTDWIHRRTGPTPASPDNRF